LPKSLETNFNGASRQELVNPKVAE